MVQCYSRRDPCLVAREEHAPLTWSWPNMKCQILQALKGLFCHEYGSMTTTAGWCATAPIPLLWTRSGVER